MLKKIILFAALAGFAVVEIPLGGQLAKAQSQPGQQSQPDQGAARSTKAVTGTVASIGSSGHSFVLQVGSDNTSKNSGTDKNTMNFVVDNNTQVQGSVKVGSSVTVEYQTTASGDNVAVSVTAQA